MNFCPRPGRRSSLSQTVTHCPTFHSSILPRCSLIFGQSLFLSSRCLRRGSNVVRGMCEVKGIGPNFCSLLLLKACPQRLDIVVHNRRLDENEQFIAFFVVGRVFE